MNEGSTAEYCVKMHSKKKKVSKFYDGGPVVICKAAETENAISTVPGGGLPYQNSFCCRDYWHSSYGMAKYVIRNDVQSSTSTLLVTTLSHSNANFFTLTPL